MMLDRRRARSALPRGTTADVVLLASLATITTLVVSGTIGRAVDVPVRSFVAAHNWPMTSDVAGAFLRAGDANTFVSASALIAALCVVLRRPWTRVLLLGVALVGSALIVTAIKRMTNRTGSYDLTAESGPGGLAYPSWHVVAVFVLVAVAQWALRPSAGTSADGRYLAVAGAAAGVEGAVLLIQQQHWLSDIVAGWLLGLLWLRVCFRAHALSTGGRR